MLVILPWKLLGIQHYFMTGWVNRFANAGDTAMEVAGNTALRLCDMEPRYLKIAKASVEYLYLIPICLPYSSKYAPSSL
ncbi:hypothetical protein L195_g029171 [Trifolium pratense]|uniref:Uncharacterized protein n=1 Tax=Trifolium pratense TaxID=57577 RepID=A0A2K3L406_TRIPR|nr:hypothetical protein L195_g029171 [Trifolium pratense]